ncbi:MAG: hypothetical protein ACFFCM_06540 [Promethearchaeota archaeon]
MNYKFNDRENERYRTLIESEFLSNPNPFPRNPVCSRDNLPKFCLGRDEEIGIIKNGIEKVAKSYNHKSAWIPINGSGGTGKTTIALYVYDSAKNKKSRDLDIDYLECAYIECPSDPNFLNIINIYKKIIKDLGVIPRNFPYFLGFQFILQLCSFFEQENLIRDDFLRKFSSVWKSISNCLNPTDLLIKIKKKAPNLARDLKYFVRDFDFVILNNEDINLPIDYIETLIDLISDNTKYRLDAFNEIMGENIQNDEEAIVMLENLISVLNFLSNKICLLIIIDNLENLPEIKDSCKNLFRILLKFRNIINNCLLLTIGSTDFWDFFNKTLNTSELNMLAGFKFDDISLMNLSEKDASRIMNRFLIEFWKSTDSKYKPKGSDSQFPFSYKAFQYLYEVNERNLRDSLKKLNNLVEEYKISNQINYLKNIKEAIYKLRPVTDPIYLFENEMNYLDDFLSNYTNRNQLSRNIEYGLFNAFTEIKEKSPYGSMIYKIEHEPNIRTESGKKAKPDIYITLFGSESIQDIRKTEIQVKAYYPSNKVKINEIDGSIELLKDKKSHYLSFITLSPLDDMIIKELQSFGPQVGRILKLSREESNYLMLSTKEFAELFFKKPILDYNSYIQILNKIGIKIPEFFEKIKKIKLIEKAPSLEPKPKIPIKVQKPLIPERPKTPDEKISNPSKLEIHIMKLLEEKEIIRSEQLIIEQILPLATSKNVIKNAMSNLKEKRKIAYFRKKPQGWRMIT